MKLEMPKRKPKSPADVEAKSATGSSRRLQAPPFLNDVYRDMRDRRLIVPALALLLAILAVPIALGPGETPAPTPPAPVIDSKADAVAPAVLAAEDVSVRDFRERLSALKRKNPFKNHFAPKQEDPITGDPASAGAGAGTSSPDPSPAPSSSPAPTSSGPSSAPGPTTSPTPSGGNELVILGTRIDVVIGSDGKRKARNNVKTKDLLPSKNRPVLMFLGADEKLTTATFLVSRDVSSTEGDGKCSGPSTDCQFLDMKAGDTQTFIYGAQEKRFTVVLKKIREVEVDRRKLKD